MGERRLPAPLDGPPETHELIGTRLCLRRLDDDQGPNSPRCHQYVRRYDDDLFRCPAGHTWTRTGKNADEMFRPHPEPVDPVACWLGRLLMAATIATGLAVGAATAWAALRRWAL